MAQMKTNACVLVLGDFGRSPRMQYHALSLAKANFLVDVIAYAGSEPPKELEDNKYIRVNYMRDVPNFGEWVPRLFAYVLKTLWQCLFLMLALVKIPKPKILILQNPPSIPTLPVAWAMCRIRKTKFIIDFHNYGFTLLQLSIGKKNMLVNICKWCEKYFGRRADNCLCVTEAMKNDLALHWSVKSHVFYDCPPEKFHPIEVSETHELFIKLGKQYTNFEGSFGQTRFTAQNEKGFILLDNRPALLVSSTSWTEDEDFSILLNALEAYDNSDLENLRLPKLVVAITGKGPLKEYYENIIVQKDFKHVEVVTLWLSAEDYPKLLASADLGISLHKSSSGLDLPMKVVDMFGSGLPVCAVSYSCIGELVKHENNGLLFSDSQELSIQLKDLFAGFPNNSRDLQLYRTHLHYMPLFRWDQSWNKNVLPLINKLCS